MLMLQEPSSIQIGPLDFLGSLGVVLTGLLPILYWKVRHRVSLVVFGLGALAWIIGVAAKTIVHLSLSDRLNELLHQALTQRWADLSYWIYFGRLTGIFEILGAVLIVARTRVRNSSWNEAIGFGVGFGGFEAMLVGFGAFSLALALMMNPKLLEDLPPEAAEFLHGPGGNQILIALASIVERLSTIAIHIFANLLIIYSCLRRQWRWLVYSVVYKTAVDGFAAWAILGWHVASDLKKVW